MLRRTGRVVCSLLGVLGVLALVAPASYAGTVDVPGSACNYDSKIETWDCDSEEIIAGFRGTDAVWTLSSQLSFDVGSSLPSGATVDSATLHLYGSFDGAGGSVSEASLAAGDLAYSTTVDEVEFEDGDPAAWHEWDVTSLAAGGGTAIVDVFPAAGTPLIPVTWSFASQEVLNSALHPYLEVEYSL